MPLIPYDRARQLQRYIPDIRRKLETVSDEADPAYYADKSSGLEWAEWAYDIAYALEEIESDIGIIRAAYESWDSDLRAAHRQEEIKHNGTV